MEGLRTAQHGGQSLNSHADYVVVGLLGGEGAAGGLGMEAKHPAFWILGTKALTHDVSPDPPSCTKFSHFLKKIIVRIEKERQARRKFVDIQTCFYGSFDIGYAICQGKCYLLHGCRACFSNVISRNRNGIPVWNILRAIFECICDEPHGRLWREDIGSPGYVFFQDIILNGAI